MPTLSFLHHLSEQTFLFLLQCNIFSLSESINLTSLKIYIVLCLLCNILDSFLKAWELSNYFFNVINLLIIKDRGCLTLCFHSYDSLRTVLTFIFDFLYSLSQFFHFLLKYGFINLILYLSFQSLNLYLTL